MYPVMPELVRFWMQERQDEAAEGRLARLAALHNRSVASARSILERLGLAANHQTTEVCICPETC